MKKINKFFLNKAEYLVQVGEQKLVMRLDYAGNRYEILGGANKLVEQIARELLQKKHGVNFAYKFSDKMEVA